MTPRTGFAVALAVGATVRVWQMWGLGTLEWADTADFLATADAGWASLELWAGGRPPGTPLLLKLVGRDTSAYTVAQAAIAVACWAALAAAVLRAVGDRVAGLVAALAVVALSVTTPVTMWDRSALSESLALSLLVLVIAAGLRMALAATPRRAVLLVGALALWVAVRDTHAAVTLAGGAALGVAVAAWWLVDRPRRAGAIGAVDPAPSRLRPWAGAALAAVSLGAVAGWASTHGERHLFPLGNVYEVRVLPYPDRVEWFADRGMPQAEMFVGPDARRPDVQPNGVPVLYVPEDDPELAPWLAWLERDGRTALARFAATHPSYLALEPLRSPERAFNNALGDRGFYAPQDMRHVPLVDRILALPRTVVLAVATGILGWLIGRGRWTPVMAVGLVVVAVAVPHGLVAWHSDGMETARHLVVPAMQLHLGVLLLAIGLARGPSPPLAPDLRAEGEGQVRAERETGAEGGADGEGTGVPSAHG
ncbi:MAG TPA: hypothetical protein VFZ79_00145 [Acidimicrobiales bacterium]